MNASNPNQKDYPMDNSTNTQPMPLQEQSALMDRLMAAAQTRQVPATRLSESSVQFDFTHASVNVGLDADKGLLMVECCSNTEEEPEVLSTCMPIAATQGEQGPANVLEFAEMLVMLLGFKALPETAD